MDDQLITERAIPFREAVNRLDTFLAQGGLSLHRNPNVDRQHDRVREDVIPARYPHQDGAAIVMAITVAVQEARAQGRNEARWSFFGAVACTLWGLAAMVLAIAVLIAIHSHFNPRQTFFGSFSWADTVRPRCRLDPVPDYCFNYDRCPNPVEFWADCGEWTQVVSYPGCYSYVCTSVKHTVIVKLLSGVTKKVRNLRGRLTEEKLNAAETVTVPPGPTKFDDQHLFDDPDEYLDHGEYPGGEHLDDEHLDDDDDDGWIGWIGAEIASVVLSCVLAVVLLCLLIYKCKADAYARQSRQNRRRPPPPPPPRKQSPPARPPPPSTSSPPPTSENLPPSPSSGAVKKSPPTSTVINMPSAPPPPPPPPPPQEKDALLKLAPILKDDGVFKSSQITPIMLANYFQQKTMALKIADDDVQSYVKAQLLNGDEHEEQEDKLEDKPEAEDKPVDKPVDKSDSIDQLVDRMEQLHLFEPGTRTDTLLTRQDQGIYGNGPPPPPYAPVSVPQLSYRPAPGIDHNSRPFNQVDSPPTYRTANSNPDVPTFFLSVEQPTPLVLSILLESATGYAKDDPTTKDTSGSVGWTESEEEDEGMAEETIDMTEVRRAKEELELAGNEDRLRVFSLRVERRDRIFLHRSCKVNHL